MSDAAAYYQHNGNVTLGFAGVPMGWAAFPFVWVPGAVMSHHMKLYLVHLRELRNKTNAGYFVVDAFKEIDDGGPGDDDDALWADDDVLWADDDVIHPKLPQQAQDTWASAMQ